MSDASQWGVVLPIEPFAFLTFSLALRTEGNSAHVLGWLCISLRSMAVLSSRAHERRSRSRSREKNKKLLPPQSPRRFPVLARLNFFSARPTKTAMLRRLVMHGIVITLFLVDCEVLMSNTKFILCPLHSKAKTCLKLVLLNKISNYHLKRL